MKYYNTNLELNGNFQNQQKKTNNIVFYYVYL